MRVPRRSVILICVFRLASTADAGYVGLNVSSVNTTVALDPVNPTVVTPVTIHRVWANFTDPDDALIRWGGGGDLGVAWIANVTPTNVGTGFLNHVNGGLLPPRSNLAVSQADSYFTIGVNLLSQIPPDQGISLFSIPGNPPDVTSSNFMNFSKGGGISTSATTSSGEPNPITLAGFLGDGDNALRVQLMHLVVPQGQQVYALFGVTVRVSNQTFTFQGQYLGLLTPPTGACCLATSCAHTYAAGCLVQGGTFQGTTIPCGASCMVGDINGDYHVDVDDLLAVIGAWGSCPFWTCRSGFLAACTADTNTDCTVSVDDLLTVISNWSP